MTLVLCENSRFAVPQMQSLFVAELAAPQLYAPFVRAVFLSAPVEQKAAWQIVMRSASEARQKLQSIRQLLAAKTTPGEAELFQMSLAILERTLLKYYGDGLGGLNALERLDLLWENLGINKIAPNLQKSGFAADELRDLQLAWLYVWKLFAGREAKFLNNVSVVSFPPFVRELSASVINESETLEQSIAPDFDFNRIVNVINEELGNRAAVVFKMSLLMMARDILERNIVGAPSEILTIREGALQMRQSQFQAAFEKSVPEIEAMRARKTEELKRIDAAAQAAEKQAIPLLDQLDETLKAEATRAIDAAEIEQSDFSSKAKTGQLCRKIGGEVARALQTTGQKYAEKIQTLIERALAEEAERWTEFSASLSEIMQGIETRFTGAEVDNSTSIASGGLGALAVFTGFGGVYSGYRVVGLKGMATGGAAVVATNLGTLLVIGLVSSFAAAFTAPLLIVGIVSSYFTGGWLTKAIFGEENIKKFRESFKKTTLEQIDKHLAEQETRANVLNQVQAAFNALKQKAHQEIESTLSDTQETLFEMRAKRERDETLSETEQERLAEVRSKTQEIRRRSEQLNKMLLALATDGAKGKEGKKEKKKMSATLSLENPTAEVNLDFRKYLLKRQSETEARLEDGVPKYAFSLDRKLRQQIAAVKPVRVLAQFLASAALPMKKQTLQMEGVVVSPKQYPDIYKVVEEAARRLDIGVPTVLVLPSAEPRAYTISSNQTVDLIVLHNSLIEMLAPEELRFIVGRECGHIHNLHSVYNTAAILLANPSATLIQKAFPGFAQIMSLVSIAASYFFLHWLRCAEVTCDRAGLICCGSLKTAEMALLKLVAGGDFAKEVNMDEYLRQQEETAKTPLRFAELARAEPLMQKRIKALRLFAECDVLHEWRPEMKVEKSRSRAEVDDECAEILDVL